MKIIAAVSMSTLLLSSCYEFSSQPLPQSMLQPAPDTQFHKELVEAFESLPEEISSKMGTTKDAVLKGEVYAISEDFLIGQDEDKGKWSLTIVMRNEHHFFSCSVIDGPNNLPDGVVVEKKENTGIAPLPNVVIGGTQEALTDLSKTLALSSTKICVAVPYKDASQGKEAGHFKRYKKKD